MQVAKLREARINLEYTETSNCAERVVLTKAPEPLLLERSLSNKSSRSVAFDCVVLPCNVVGSNNSLTHPHG